MGGCAAARFKETCSTFFAGGPELHPLEHWKPDVGVEQAFDGRDLLGRNFFSCMAERWRVMRPHGDDGQINCRMAREVPKQPAQMGVVGTG